MRSYGRSGYAITIPSSTALPSYNPGVIPQRRHAVYTNIAEAHGTQRNETRPTFNGSKISSSNASIRVRRWWRRGGRTAGFIRHSVYTGVYRCLQSLVGLIKHRRSRCNAEGCGWSRGALLKRVPVAATIIVVGNILLARQLRNMKRRRNIKSCSHN